jgi:hypothetical protein
MATSKVSEQTIVDVSDSIYLIINKLTGDTQCHGRYSELAQLFGNQLLDAAINGEDGVYIAEEATYMYNSNIGYSKNRFFCIK